MQRRGLLSIILIVILLMVFLTGQTTASAKNILLSKAFTLSAMSDQCNFADYQGTIAAGTQIFGTIKSSGYVYFNIMTAQQYNQSQVLMSWGCRNIRATGLLMAGAITSYSLNWTAPNTGVYHFVFTNTESYDDSISITLWTS